LTLLLENHAGKQSEVVGIHERRRFRRNISNILNLILVTGA
jgi:hypothetical protein